MDLLDHGYIKLIDSWGSDERIIESARMSTGKGFLGWGPKCDKCGEHYDPTEDGEKDGSDLSCPVFGCDGQLTRHGDEKLLRFLWENKHHTPFEMAGLTLEVQAPLFVFREWHRHRTQSYNELSARYTELPDMYYVPSIERLMAGMQSTVNKQGSQSGFTQDQAMDLRDRIQTSHQLARANYEALLGFGLSREISRVVVPVAQYSRMRASANLRNWLAFVTLRSAAGAQWEIRQYSDALSAVIADHFPRTWEIFKDNF